MSNPLFWLGLSLGLLALSVVVLLVLAIPVLVGLARTARSAEQLLEMLNRELPATLIALRQTGADLGELAGDVTSTAQSAKQIVGQVDRGLPSAQRQAHQAQRTSKSLWAGARAAWGVLTTPSTKPLSRRASRKRRKYPPTPRPSTTAASAAPETSAASPHRSPVPTAPTPRDGAPEAEPDGDLK